MPLPLVIGTENALTRSLLMHFGGVGRVIAIGNWYQKRFDTVMLDAFFGGIGRVIAIGNRHRQRIDTVMLDACVEALAVPLQLVIGTEHALARSL